MRKRSYLAPAAIWLALLVAGCGGGGGGSTSGTESAAPVDAPTDIVDELDPQEEADAASADMESAQRVLSSNYYRKRPVKVTVTGSGTVTGDRGGINCNASGGPQCSASFSQLTYVRLTAKPASGSKFTGWSGACAGTNTVCRVSNTVARNVKANFSRVQSAPVNYTLNVSVSGNGGVISNPGGVSCGTAGSNCSASFASGTTVKLTAQVPSGYVFQGWSGACSGTASTCQVTMSQARSVSAAFAVAQPTRYSLDVAVSGTGNVRSTPSGIDCGNSATSCKASYNAGTSVTLTATPASGQVFNGWGGDCAGSGSSCTVSLSAQRRVEARFVAQQTSQPAPAPVPPQPAPGTGTSAGLSPACSAIYGSSSLSLKTGNSNDAIPSLAKPAKGKALSEPTYKTCLVRVTDHNVEPPSGFARNDYSRRQAFNADSSKLIVYAYDGHWHLYDAQTFAHLKTLNGPAADAEPQWHPTDPNLLYYLPTNGGMTVHELNVSTNTSRVVGNFSGRLPWSNVARLWTKSEGSPSADARYWAFQAETSNFAPVGIVVWDRVTDTIVATMNNSERPDHLSMSPSGNYVVVSWLNRVVAYDRNLKNPRTLQNNSEHSDIALDANGDDQYVAVDYQSNNGAVFMINLRTGQRTDLFGTYISGTATALHISGKAFNKPGWVLVSTYANYGGAQQWLHKKIMAVQLKANPTIYHLAHTRVVDNGYWTEPQASVNRDFTKVLFTSNWGVNSSMDVDAYMIELPAGAIK
ncbi:InlB B-repeat-containing protein [Caldimonas thermodepolymerans]|jgi:hypothetical protein|uniref:List-Bact-rpt repeat protein n=1 Tax=Caldimonas thermodepolymerans TaxID=215580 RepID=A0AA46DHN7_9BURK|nr:InlB B-repeat-containing protein [Caldimonas thermodepolymerans]TCP09690.1 List-Bact-rpt repeat protein [Caldimonas thermodepolymerans]UZG49703.1 InlB B-repeat-containing protein [Caldimonas thermodepolymerans]